MKTFESYLSEQKEIRLPPESKDYVIPNISRDDSTEWAFRHAKDIAETIEEDIEYPGSLWEIEKEDRTTGFKIQGEAALHGVKKSTVVKCAILWTGLTPQDLGSLKNSAYVKRWTLTIHETYDIETLTEYLVSSQFLYVSDKDLIDFANQLGSLNPEEFLSPLVQKEYDSVMRRIVLNLKNTAKTEANRSQIIAASLAGPELQEEFISAFGRKVVSKMFRLHPSLEDKYGHIQDLGDMGAL